MKSSRELSAGTVENLLGSLQLNLADEALDLSRHREQLTRPHADIIHIDVDAFFVQMEVLRQPRLEGKPVVVGGSNSRGVVAAASYEARVFGIHSGMASAQASRLCPELIFIRGDMPYYAETSRRIMDVLSDFTPDVEPYSIDEAFMDVDGCHGLFGSTYDIAKQTRDRVLEQENVTISAGVGTSKLVAKMASKRAKPRATPHGIEPGAGVFVVKPGAELEFLHPMAVEDIWGLGKSTCRALEPLGVRTVGDLAKLPVPVLVEKFGKVHGLQMAMIAQGIDPSPVKAREVEKSMSHEVTFPYDLSSRAELEQAIWQLSEKVATRLRASDHFAKTVVLKVRHADFATATRRHTIAQPTDNTKIIAQEVIALLTPEDVRKQVRLLGVGVAGFQDRGATQQLTLGDIAPAPSSKLDRAIDSIRSRYGADSIRRAVVGAADFKPGAGFVPPPVRPLPGTTDNADAGTQIDADAEEDAGLPS